MLKEILSKEIGRKVIGWNSLVQNRNKCRAVVNTVMNICFIKCGKFLDYLRYC